MDALQFSFSYFLVKKSYIIIFGYSILTAQFAVAVILDVQERSRRRRRVGNSKTPKALSVLK